MKAICVSCFDYYETRIKGIIRYLENKGYEVRYLLSDFNHFSKTKYSVNYGDSKQLHVLPYEKNISSKRLLSHYFFSKEVMREIKQFHPDAIYCIVPPNSLVKELSKYKIRKKEVKLIYDIYDVWPESFPYRIQSPIIQYAFGKWASLRDNYIFWADRLIVVSQKLKEGLDDKYDMDAKVLLPSLDLGDLPNYSFDISKKIEFLYLGNVNYITDIELGTNLLSKLVKDREIILHIIGEGKNRERWINMLNQVGIKTVCHGIVFDQNKKRKIFEQCNFGLNIPRKEIKSTMALKAIEYMHFGLPFINSGLGDNEEMVSNNKIGINVNEKNIDEKILTMKSEELRIMSFNCIKYYKDTFLTQDYNKILGDVV